MTPEEMKQSVENAMAAFNEMKTMYGTLKGKYDSIAPKMDVFDQAKFDKIQTDINKAIEDSQSMRAEQKARDDKLTAAEGQIKALETALSRVPSGVVNSEDEIKRLVAKRNKLFNEFARSGKDKLDFEDFLEKRAVADPEVKSLSVNSDPNGGYLVLPEFGGVINTFVYESSPIRQLASVITIGTDSYKLVTDNDQVTSGWVGETQSRSNTNTPVVGEINIPVNELYANPQATQKMLEDPVVDIEAWLTTKVSQKFARDEATAFVVGTGVMQPKGLLSYASGTSVGLQQIQQVVSGNAAAFTYNGLINLQNAVKEPYQPNSVFLIQRASNANIMQIVDGQGRPIFNMSYDKNAGLQPTILGKEVYFANDIPLFAANALAAIYGDIRQAYQIVDRRGIMVLRDPYSNKPYVAFYTTKRVGGAVINFEAIKIQQIHS
jgi:HK97 family phage major capsid protein